MIGRTAPGMCPRGRPSTMRRGYTVVNGVSVRDNQRRTRELLSGKAFEATTPVGPVLVTPDEFGGGEPYLESAARSTAQAETRRSTSNRARLW